MDAMLVSQWLLWGVVLVLCAIVAALARQIGVLHERIAPAGALTLGKGPEPGERVEPLSLVRLDGSSFVIGGTSARGHSTLVFFLSPTCPVCKELLPAVLSVRRSERGWLDVVFASDGDLGAQRAFAQAQGLDEAAYVVSTELGLRFRVPRLPYAVLLDAQGVLQARGLVNTREHLESLFEAQRLQAPTMQDYLRQQRGENHAA
ncbi:MAG: hypothetical protein FJ191_10275 [Gammaproteobacteria bacterium]|nr:hypothetical protein [Gammaproteobacteria bacterium]